jgi:hypothetical protein
MHAVTFLGLSLAISGSLTVSLDTSFPAAKRADFNSVAHDVADVMRDIFGQSPIDTRPVVCFVGGDIVPLVDATRDPAIIWIRMGFRQVDFDRLDFSKFAYQLGHELGHVYLNPLRTNGLIETLCDAISYEVLDRLAELWPKKYANHAPWRDFAPSFREYIQANHRKYTANLPADLLEAEAGGDWEAVRTQLKNRQSELDANPTSFDSVGLRSVGAMALRSGSVPWKDMIGLAGHTAPSAKEDPTFREKLPTDLSFCTERLRTALRRIGR